MATGHGWVGQVEVAASEKSRSFVNRSLGAAAEPFELCHPLEGSTLRAASMCSRPFPMRSAVGGQRVRWGDRADRLGSGRSKKIVGALTATMCCGPREVVERVVCLARGRFRTLWS